MALSSEATTALLGGFGDNSEVGAAWVQTRAEKGTTWSQQGPKLTGRGEVSEGVVGGKGEFGYSVALSPEGNTALIGGPHGQRRRRRGVGLHALGHDLDPAGPKAHRPDRRRGRRQ